MIQRTEKKLTKGVEIEKLTFKKEMATKRIKIYI